MEVKSNVFLEVDDNVCGYPASDDSYSPNVAYAEYPWKDEVAKEKNPIYDMVRNVFIQAGLDMKNHQSAAWNPLGAYISEGNTVLIKPNWVGDKNKNKNAGEKGLECMVTHPSVVRAVIDYVIIALQGNGRIILADAPMQSCDLGRLFCSAGYGKMLEFYQEKGVSVEVYDLRKYSVGVKVKGVYTMPNKNENGLDSIKVNLGKDSLHSDNDTKEPKYKVEDYEETLTALYHSHGKHMYEVNELVLQADIVVNLPKPKTHRLAGFTGACKNVVGIVRDKACLPHRVEGDAESKSGDAYKKSSVWKDWMTMLNELRIRYSLDGMTARSKLFDLLMKCCYVIGSLTTGDFYRIGSWYGNDTIWRTVIDLNRILLYADSKGLMRERPQRKMIAIGDMVISGERNGPVAPSPKMMGMLIFSDNNLAFDRVLCEIMGLDAPAFRMFSDGDVLSVFGYQSERELNGIRVFGGGFHGIPINEFPCIEKWHFRPHDCWAGHIEKRIV